MNNEDSLLESECRVFTRFLIGVAPEAYVIEKYVEAHGKVAALTGGDAFERRMVRIAARGPVLAKAVDAYARLAAPRSLLRNKLVLLLAILESCAPSYRLLEAVDGAAVPVQFLRLAGRGLLGAVSILLGAALVVPLRLASPRAAREKGA